MASILRSCHAECQRKCAMLRCFNKSARQNSPCTRKICEKAAFRASWANFVPNMRCPGSCWASFFTELLLDGSYWARFFAPTGTAPRSRRRRGALHVGTGGGLPPAKLLCTVSPPCWTLVSCNSPATQCRIRFCGRGVPSGAAGAPYLRCTRASRTGITKPPGARPGGGWSGRRESNPPLKLGKLPFYR